MSVHMLAWAWEVEAAPLTKFVLVTLADYANHDGGCFPSVGRLAIRTGMSERSVQRAIADLEAEGVLTRKPAKDGRLWFYLNHNLPIVDVPSNAKQKAPDWLRAEILASSDCKCYWCRQHGTEDLGPDGRPWTMDRLKPGRYGGRYEVGNVVLSCHGCNTRKGARDAKEFGAKMWGDAQPPQAKGGVTQSHTGGDAEPPHGVTQSHPIRKREPKVDPLEGDLFKSPAIEHPELPPQLRTPELLTAWAEWRQHRTQKRAPMTPLATKKQVAEMLIWGAEIAVVAINHSIKGGYTGLFLPAAQAAKFASPKPKGQITKENALRMPSRGPQTQAQ